MSQYDRRALQRGALVIIFYIVLLFVLALIPSCTTTKYVPVETIRTDTVAHYVWLMDSVWRLDSVYYSVVERGDTVYLTLEKYKYIDRIKSVTDTVKEVKMEIKEVPVEVEKDLTAWQKFKIDFAEVIMVIAALAIAGIFILIFLRRK